MSILPLAIVLVLLLVAITRFKIHPFLALLVCSLIYGPLTGLFALESGLSAPESASAFLNGFADTMKWIGVVIVLGALIGELLNESGGTLKIAHTMLAAVGAKRLPLAMGITGYVVSIPAFVDIAYIMLKPIVEVLAVKARRPVLVVGLSLTAGLTASHALLPPTPGPLASAGILEADIGRVIVVNLVVAAFAVTGGLLWVTFYCARVTLPYDRKLAKQLDQPEYEKQGKDASRCSFVAAMLPILIPLALIACSAFLKPEWNTGVWSILRFFGTPIVALLLGMLAAVMLLQWGERLSKLHQSVERAIAHSAVVLMITGAGGGFGAVIKASGVGDAIAVAFGQLHLPPVLFPFLLAAALTTATGSLTVAMVTGSSVVASMLGSLGISPELAVALVGAGSLCVIHANASFFWLLSRLHEVPPDLLYRTYSMQSICMSLGGLAGALVMRWFGVA